MRSDFNFKNEANALNISEYRAKMVAKNIANSNTPDYKARDINFAEVMNHTRKNTALVNTDVGHISPSSPLEGSARSYYRVPMQNKSNGNTVDEDIERKNFVENTLRYQSSLSFLQQKATLLIKAIKGE